MTTILYAEDDENDAFFMRRAFTKSGSVGRLIIVPDGQKAVHYVLGFEEFSNREQHPVPSFVMLDLKMPNVTGLEALSEIRAHPVGHNIPIVIFTSSTQEVDIAAAHALKAHGYFLKPSNAIELITLIQNFAKIWSQKPQAPLARLEIPCNRLPS